MQSFHRLGNDKRFLVEIHESCSFFLPIYSEAIQESVRKANLLPNIQECNKVCVKGTTYNKGDALCVRQAGYQYNTEIGKICLILFNDDRKVFLVMQIIETTFLPHRRSYKIGEIIKYECVPLEQAVSNEPLHIYNLGKLLCVKPKFGFVAHNSEGN